MVVCKGFSVVVVTVFFNAMEAHPIAFQVNLGKRKRKTEQTCSHTIHQP
jgi:hypothetical protein